MLIHDVKQLTPAWLTQVLDTPDDPVQLFEMTNGGQTNVSRFYHLRVTYQSGAPALPRHLFLKLVSVQYPQFFGKELRFYNELAPMIRERFPQFGTLRCFYADYDPDNGNACYLFDDVSRTHFSRNNGTPTQTHYQQVIGNFAMLHATWWQHPRVGDDIGQGHTVDSLDAILQRTQDKVQAFLASDTPVPDTWKRAFEQVCQRWPPHRRAQMLSGETMTLVHRDPHPGNFLYPYDSQTHRTLIIDWDAWRVDNGTVDLAYMMAFQWDKALRDAHEMPLLRHYHQHLMTCGITGYTWDDCLQDYRASVVRCLLFMLGVWRPERTPGDSWWQVVKRGVQAYHDLSCELVV